MMASNTYHVDPEATAHELMNAATEWLQFGRGLTGLLADLVHEADRVDCQHMGLGNEATSIYAKEGPNRIARWAQAGLLLWQP